jgi:hypothetical protein
MNRSYFLILLVVPGLATAQETSDYPITVAVFNQGVSYPYSQVITRPIHPGVMVETSHFFRSGTHSWGWNATVGYYFHRHFAHGFFLQGNLLYRYQTSNGIYGQFLLGTGYLHVFRAADEYKFRNGRYIKNTDLGNGRITPSLGMELGYKIKRNESLSSAAFIRYQTWIQYPFSPGFIPLLSHTNLHLGYTFYPNKSKK